MRTTLQRWGNSQGIRIPRGILKLLHISIGDSIEIHLDNNSLILQPTSQTRAKYSLKDLVAQIPVKYKPEEYDWGKASGKEAW